MIDNGKYRIVLTTVCVKKFIVNLNKNAIVKTLVNLEDFKLYRAYVYNLDDIENYSKEELKKLPCMEINVKYFKEEITIDITNSLRKWFFGKKKMRNFNKSNFAECLMLLSTKLSLEYEELLKAKITILEIGLNLRFDANYKPFLITIMEHKTLRDRNIFGKETVYFEGENFKLIFYDKLKETYDKTDMRSSTFKKISEKFFFLRIEIKFKKVSGVEFAKKNVSTINELLDNWEFVYNYFTSQIKNVTFVDWISPRIVDNFKSKSDSEYFDWLAFLGTEKIGFDNIILTANEFLKRPSVQKRRLKQLAEKFRELKNPSFEEIIFKSIYNSKKYLLS